MLNWISVVQSNPCGYLEEDFHRADLLFYKRWRFSWLPENFCAIS